MIFKDEQLELLARQFNVARFASFAPNPGGGDRLRYARIGATSGPHSLVEAVQQLLQRSTSNSVNIRTFRPGVSEKGNPFVYGLRSTVDAVDAASNFLSSGYHVIVNETIDINDGGVSGVVLGDVIEFAPEDTPRAVEKPGVASLPRGLGMETLELIYGFRTDLRRLPAGYRTEFSIHPHRVGYRQSHTIIWEHAEDPSAARSSIAWPNRFSEFIGDKAYGLLVAHALGVRVPRTTVISRRVAPFTFGEHSDTGEVWTRTAPSQQSPGKYTTVRGWTDPFSLLTTEDPQGDRIPSILSQDGVAAIFSGATLPSRDGNVVVEGVEGFGDGFMLGRRAPELLPDRVSDAVADVVDQLESALGGVRIEWAWDGRQVWVLQLHRVSPASAVGEGSAGGDGWVVHRVDDGLEALARRITEAQVGGGGVVVRGLVGVTSHVGDLLRAGGVPWKISH